MWVPIKAVIGYRKGPNSLRNRVQTAETGNRKNIKYSVNQQNTWTNLSILSDFFN